MSLFRKPKKNLRQRVAESEEEEDKNENRDAQVKDKPRKPKQTENDGLQKKKSLLSFEHDLEADDAVEEFQVKKSIQSRRITKKLHQEKKQREKEKKPDDIPKPQEDIVDHVSLRNEETTKEKENVTILSGREAEMIGYESRSEDEADEEEKNSVRFRQPDPFRRVLERGGIPDAAMIHAARKKRQQAREMGTAGDFISLEDSNQTKTESARLVREDENDKSDEEETGDGSRLEFTVDLAKKSDRERREAFLAAEREASPALSDEADEDAENWENQQIQKAIRQRQLESVQQEALYEAASQEMKNSQQTMKTAGPSVSRTAIPQSILASSAPVPNSQELYQKLKNRLTSMDEVHRRHASDLDALRSELRGCQAAVQQLRAEQPRLGQRFRFFQETRGYVHDLVDCLSTKFEEIDPLEKRWVALLERRCRELVERRRADVRDEASESAGPGLGKSTDPDKFRRCAEREQRRRKRQERRKDPSHKEGLSSDDEMDEKRSSNLKSEIAQLQEESRTVFSDVVEEFSSIEEVTRRFAQWRAEDMSSYRDTYVNLFLPRVITPLVRLELLQMSWNPLEKGVTLQQMGWYRVGLKYGLTRGETLKQLKDDPDKLLLSRVVELAVLPLLTSTVRAAYDPCSAVQTSNLQSLLTAFLHEYPTLSGSSKAVQQLLNAVKEKFEAALENDVFIPWHFVSKSPVFVSRQFWGAAKLLKNILLWREILSDAVLRKLAVEQLLKQIVFALKMTLAANPSSPLPLDLCSYFAPNLPQQWLGPLAPAADQLQALIELLMTVARNADTASSSGRKTVERVAKLLTALQARAEAQEVLAKYK